MKIKKRSRQFPPKSYVLLGGMLVCTILGGFIWWRSVAPPDTATSSPQAGSGAVSHKQVPHKKNQEDTVAMRPTQLAIPSLGIDAPVLPMGILGDGALEAPKTAWDVGWYEQSALPGSGKAALLLDGHVNDTLGTPGVFYKLDTLEKGDTITIGRKDKRKIEYAVVKVDQKPIEAVDMADMLRSISPGKEGLNLITCGGDYDRQRKTYKDRILIYAIRTS